jgi:hypothetical protein
MDRKARAERSKSTLVVVNPVAPPAYPRLEEDPLFKKLQELPAFVPLMFEAEHNTNLWGKNRALNEIRSKLNPSSFIQISRLYEEKLRRHSESVNSEQRRLSKCVREADLSTSKLVRTLYEREKKFARNVEKLNKLNDITHTLSKCQMVLYECRQQVQTLNDMLPLDDRLEPFVWNEDDVASK